MNVFLSWSGERSKQVAELLKVWIKCVLQASQPWISTRDIDRGALWFDRITEQLGETTIGIVCLTAENKTKPWILFEAGALAKGLSRSRVCTLLVDLNPTDIEDPLAQFNHTLPTKDSMRALVSTLNRQLPNGGLDEPTLENVFETYWPQFDVSFKDVIAKTNTAAPQEPARSDESILAEILENSRSMSVRLRVLEEQHTDERAAAAARISREARLLQHEAVLDDTKKLLAIREAELQTLRHVLQERRDENRLLDLARGSEQRPQDARGSRTRTKE
jgi:hypothetical protein